MKRLNLFESCMLQINDKNYLKIADFDVICRKSQWRKELSSKYKKLRMVQLSNNDQIVIDLNGSNPIKLTTTACDYDCSAEGDRKTCDKTKLCPTQSNQLIKERNNETVLSDDDDWLTEPECCESFSDSGTTVSSSCSSTATPRGSPKKSPLLANKIRKLKKKAKPVKIVKLPLSGEEVVTEALVVYTTATVVWQDGTIEAEIPSTDLCPIHHLDDHEFFPGDFVLVNDAVNPSYRDYGVIQNVDHHGRTARVKWFCTYTTNDNPPEPTYKGESEVSVYDLKDHPDFQYRPGTIVIRVANFNGAETTCTAGQVIDNYPSGQVKVWWVDDHISMCWPQDIFEVGQYDSENNFWGNDSDNNSWETEDEISELGGLSPQKVSKPHLAANLERARVAMARLEELFIINPQLQNQEIMKKLLMVYKKCRYLDRLMDTSFFHEEHFMGLVERVRKGGNQTTAERVQDQKNRLFNQTPSKLMENSSTPQKKAKLNESQKSESLSTDDHSLISPKKSSLQVQRHHLSTSSDISSLDEIKIDNDSGHYSNKTDATNSNNDLFNVLLNPHSELDNVNNLYMNINDDLNNTSSIFSISSAMDTDNSASSECVSARLCRLIKAQLIKALQEVSFTRVYRSI